MTTVGTRVPGPSSGVASRTLPLHRIPRRRSGPPRPLVAVSALIAIALSLPLLFLILVARNAGTDQVWHLINRQFTATLLWNTVRLAAVVTALCVVIGTAAAYCVERTDLPLRWMWAVLVVIPLAIPDFVVAFGWKSLSTHIVGFHGAAIIMTLAVYPLVYLPVAASLRNADPSQEEMSRSLGVGPIRTFVRVTLGQARSAIIGGALLVCMVLLAEFGAFEIVGYRTFTTEIFAEFQTAFNLPTASALSLVLVLVSLVVVGADLKLRGRPALVHTGSQVQRRAAPVRLGRATIPVFVGFVALIGLALGVPIGSSVYWMLARTPPAITGVSLLGAASHTAMYAAGAGVIATIAAIPLAVLSVRHPGRGINLLERSTLLVLGMPGLVTALALSYFVEHYGNGVLYQSATLLVIAYSILFYPLALVAVRASVMRAPARLDDVARSLGRGPVAVLFRVTLPLVAPGLAAAFCLVFLSAVTELTATLILVPTGVQTLATQFWAYQSNLSYGQAAPFALLIMGIAAVPSVILGLWFDRLPSRTQ
jgi:iron(III) transport system permease protein